MKIGLVGFPGCGKTTVFNALTGLSAETGYGATRGKTNLGVTKVPDKRIDALAAMFKPKKTTFAEIAFCDVAAQAAGAAGQGLDADTLRAMREMDALCQVVRGFPDAGGAPAEPLAEAKNFEAEMNLSDLILVEKRLDRLAKERAKGAEVDLFQKLKDHLEAGTPLRLMSDLSAAEVALASGFRFLTQKPLLLVLNVSEADVVNPPPSDLAAYAQQTHVGLVVLAGMVEMDIAQMGLEEQKEFTLALGLEEPAVGRFIRAAYALLELISFLTSGEDECRAWTITRGSTAPRAAGKIHSDIERGFIRAEVMHFEDLLRLGSEGKCREAGKLRAEGKEYVVKDGDVLNFLFNV